MFWPKAHAFKFLVICISDDITLSHVALTGQLLAGGSCSLWPLWSLMLFSGYLTYEEMRISPITELRSYSLKIPNQEIKSFFRQSFIESYTKGDVHFYGTMMEDLFLGNLDSFINKFK